VTRPLRWTEQAVDHLGAIAEYVSRTSPIYAEQLVQRISTRLNQIREWPESGRVVPEYDAAEIREVIEWPYRLIYREHAGAIEVLGIVHGRQDLRLARPE
jgi:toxin ParE1/3/4